MLFIHRALEHRARAVVALLALVLATFVLAACGDDGNGGGGGGGGDVETLLTQTFTGSHQMDSGNVDLRLRVEAEGDPSIQGPIEVNVTGPFQAGEGKELPSFDLRLEIRAQGQGFEAGLTSAGGRVYVLFGGTAYEVPEQLVTQMKQSWAKSQRKGSDGPKFDLAGIDPMDWLRDPRVEGTETAGGVESDHIVSQVDVSALLDDVDALLAKFGDQVPSGIGTPEVPDRIPADTRREIEDAVKSADVEIWSGVDDHTLRKLQLRLAVEPPESGDGPRSLDLDLSVELNELNEPQTIETPTTVRPLAELLGQLQGFLGGALGGGALGGAFGGAFGGGGSGDEPDIEAYTDCLQDAGGDADKAQDCAALLNP